MLAFYFDSESVQELLGEIKRVEYLARYLEGTIEGVELRPGDWPAENFRVEVGLERYRDRESYEYYAGSPDIHEWPALVESVKMSLDGGKQKRTYTVYDKTAVGKVELVASGPSLPENWGEQILVAEEWPDWGEDYVQVTPLFCWTAPEDGTEWEMRCCLPSAFFEAYGDHLVYGWYDPETGEAETDLWKSLRAGKPGTFEEGNVHIVQSFGMASGLWYAVLRPTS